ncbi:hypothetical protein HKD37_16G045804 [Glycine soja]
MMKMVPVLITTCIPSSLTDNSQFNLERNYSDHCPIILKYKIIDWGPKPFKVFDGWLKIKDYQQVVKDCWSAYQPMGWGGFALKNKLKNLKHSRRRNAIRGLLIDGSWVEDPLLVKAEVLQHFQNRFHEPQLQRPNLDGVHFSVLSAFQKDSMVEPFKEEEITSAVWSCGNDKSLGPNGLPTKDNLVKRQIKVENDLCPFYHSQPETASHLFFTCDKIMPLWWEFLSWVKEDKVIHCRPMDNFLQHYSSATSKDSNRRWKMWWLAVTNSIWRLSNDMIFHNQSFDMTKLTDSTLFLLWTSSFLSIAGLQQCL